MPWPSCSPYRQNTPTGAQRCPKAYATAPRPRHSKPWSTSISMLSQTSTFRADTDATEKGTMKHHKGLASFNPNQRGLLDILVILFTILVTRESGVLRNFGLGGK